MAMCGLMLAGFFAGALWIGIPVGAGGQEEPAQRPSAGDANGDSVVDMSDAVYLLTYLFQGGEPPVACAEDAELVDRVAELSVQVADLEGRLAVAENRLLRECEQSLDRIIENEDGTFTDTCTGLMWAVGSLDGVMWEDAVEIAAASDAAGHTDWRLPTAWEVEDLWPLRGAIPGLHISVRALFPTSRFWTSTAMSAEHRFAARLGIAVDHAFYVERGHLGLENIANDSIPVMLVRTP